MLKTTRTVVIVDNHPVFRAGLCLIVSMYPGLQVVGEANSGHSAIDVCQRIQPDILLIDVNMPNGNGIETTTILHQQFPEMKIIAVSAFNHEAIQLEMLRAGAVGYISKEADISDIGTLINAIVVNCEALTKSPSESFDLTHAEYKVLFLLGESYSRQKIADELSISVNTVKMHLRNLYQKLGVTSANEAIKIAMQNHLLS